MIARMRCRIAVVKGTKADYPTLLYSSCRSHDFMNLFRNVDDVDASTPNLITIEGTMKLCEDLEVDPENVSSLDLHSGRDATG